MSKDHSGNLLAGLHKYASRQGENFTTEAFAHLLRYLSQYEPETACDVIEKLSEGEHKLTIGLLKDFTIGTQQRHEFGVTDIELEGPHDFVMIEVKVSAPVGEGQLKRYLDRVREHKNGRRGSLVLLTALPYSPEARLGISPDSNPTWYKVADWLDERIERLQPVGRYVVEQFLGFLRSRGLTMGKIDSELEPGLRALMNLLTMLEKVVVGIGAQPKVSSSSGDNGYSTRAGGLECWLGVYYAEPSKLVFRVFNVSVDRTTIEKAGNFGFQRKGAGNCDRSLTFEEFTSLV